MNLREGLGYCRLLPPEQEIYKIAIRAFSSKESSFDVSKMHASVDLMKVVNTVLGDNPTIIYFDKTLIEKVESVFEKQVELTGILPKSQIDKMNLELDEKANQIVSSVKAAASDDYSFLIKVYEYLQSNICYDTQEFNNMLSSGRSINPLSHNAYGALVNGLAVCDGFSSAFSFLLNKLGFESMTAVGVLMQSVSSRVKHAWNIVKVRNRYYHIDATSDTKTYNQFNGFSYNYFALDDTEIATNHDWDINTTPACSYNDLSYFLKNGLFVNNIGQCNDIIRAALRKADDFIRIRLSYNIALPGNIEEHLAQTAMKEASYTGISRRIEYHWNEVTRCFIAKFLN